MNKNSLNTVLYALITVLIIYLIFKALPYALLAGVIIWFAVKIYRFLSSKFSKDSHEERDYSYKKSEVHVEDDDLDTSKAIDVDYKDVD